MKSIRRIRAVALASLFTGAAQAQQAPPTVDTLEQQIQTLTHEIDALKSQLQQLKDQTTVKPAAPGAPSAAAAPSPASAAGTAVAQAPPPPPPASPLENLSLWGYGEVYYTRPQHLPSLTQEDLARGVFGIGYQFNERTLFNSEFEVEHAVSSSVDPGEFEVEQLYIDRTLNQWATLRGGLMLMPFGLLNEHHEPTNFYGVQRNFVETLIIPSTWREGGLEFRGSTPFGLQWAFGLTTGFDLSKWTFAPEFPPYATALNLIANDVAPLQQTHQELAFADASHLSEHLSLVYTGIPGLTVGVAGFTGNSTGVAPPPGSQREGTSRVTLWEAHTRWTPGRFDLSALYARGIISNTAQANEENAGSPQPIPSAFHGYFAQAAYNAFSAGDYRVSPFVRYERYNMGSSYAGSAGPLTPTGLVPLSAGSSAQVFWPVPADRVWTYGANFYVTPNVVFKADYQTFQTNSELTRFDLGLGLAF